MECQACPTELTQANNTTVLYYYCCIEVKGEESGECDEVKPSWVIRPITEKELIKSLRADLETVGVRFPEHIQIYLIQQLLLLYYRKAGSMM